MEDSRQPGRSPDWIDDAIVYGIDIARFYDGNDDGIGDLAGVSAKLDYLHDLGVNCLWLLPFYPSDRRDNGYAVTNYLGVDTRFGELDDFRDLVATAHERGIRVMIDLVIQHTSSKHPWFQAAESDPKSRYVDYYVWSKHEPEDDESQSVFPEEEDGIWDYSERAGAYFRHKFYSFQPDLRLENDEVWEEVKRIVDFWVSLGVDGFRIDAATLMFTRPDAGESSFEERFDDLRRYLADRAPYIALLGEADVEPDELAKYFDSGRFDALYNFLGNNALYLSLVRESAAALLGTLEKLRRPLAGRMLNFVRNLDELDLEQLTDDERAEVFETLAPEQHMRIYGRGIRRGWAPMMVDDDQLHMSLSLLFALPGIPLLMYGQEIGIGDDLDRDGRDAVRLPMQWSAGAWGGFTTNGDSSIAESVQPGGDRGYHRVNVEAQVGDQDSLHALTRELAALRSDHRNIGRPGWERVDGPEQLLILRYGDVTVLHNLSADPQQVPELEPSRLLLGDDVSSGTLRRYGFAWLLSQ